MSTFLSTKSLYYKDVNLIAQPCVINSRSDIPKELNRIFVSPMHAVVGKTFAKAATDLGLSVCLHRFHSVEEQIAIYHAIENHDNTFVSIGLNDKNRIDSLIAAGVNQFIVDIANGGMHKQIHDLFLYISSKVGVKKMIVGNVHERSSFDALAHKLSGIEKLYIRVGIGNGSACLSSVVTGFNRGQITELQDCDSSSLSHRYATMMADGGIKTAGDASKAFGIGAGAVMLGGYFARAEESETHVIGDRTFWGGASHKQQIISHGSKHKHSEGTVYHIDQESVMPLKDIVTELWGGLASAVSYSGYKSLSNFIGNGIFEVKR